MIQILECRMKGSELAKSLKSFKSSYQLIERFNGRLPGNIGDGNNCFSFSHVDDVVEGHISALDKGKPDERYLLTGENASIKQVFDIAAIITNTKKKNLGFTFPCSSSCFMAGYPFYSV